LAALLEGKEEKEGVSVATLGDTETESEPLDERVRGLDADSVGDVDADVE
jgi:hypothetical protein